MAFKIIVPVKLVHSFYKFLKHSARNYMYIWEKNKYI